MEFRLRDLIRLWQLPVMLASLYSDRERAIKRCNISRFPINTGTHTETDIPLTSYTHFWTSLTSMTLPNVPSPRVETTSSERVKVQQLQSNISYQITTKFNIQHHPPLLWILVILFYFEKIDCKEVLFYQNIVGSISSSAVGYWIVVFWWKYITHSFNFRQKQIFSSSKCKALPAYPFFSILLIWNWKKHQKYWDQSHKKKHKK